MLEELKEKVCTANKQLVTHGLVLFTWGNVSGIDRATGTIAIKPSGVPYETLQPSDIVLLDLNGKIIEGTKRPSSDTPTHLELYRAFPAIGGIVHTHSTHATSFAQAEQPIDCFGTTHADYFHGAIPLIRGLTKEEVETEYELNTGKVIVNHFLANKIDPVSLPGCLIARHGPFTWGKTPLEAVYHAAVLEQLAKMNILTKNLRETTTPIERFLLEKHYQRKHGKNAYYGQQ